ncbi:SDR family oxidoreductase [Planomicrobium sp. CPCC 101110]|uniref:SDR family oxidoreductase n=1 Tax=Planomicrobium sp. CPCC 101110 TaxID=2599619 RepID=UPI0011B44102|nr:SDR family oxidoreductase [Planomicrobium sp. CPCC 101110]TWT25261.1 SDR family oxidoreductase [Planomicrobium sp. CPCC 101110]
MKILILGGTRFLGRFLTETALRKGHDVTLFNRGRENSGLFPEAEKLIGDRNGNLKALEGRSWDAVIDTCGFVPWAVRESAGLLAGAAGHYTFISSASVYDELQNPGIDENHPVSQLPPGKVEELEKDAAGPASYEYYGELKFLCEKEVEKSFPGRNLIVRAGLIVGPYDYSDRFNYWVSRIAEGGEVLAPGRRDKEVQFIDVRDLAEWIINMAEEGGTGTFNATGPESRLTMEQLLEECKTVSGSDAELVWADEEFLLSNDVRYWSEMPLWIPDRENMAGFLAVAIKKALRNGLSFRPLHETIRDTLGWEAGRPDMDRKAGLDPEKEKAVLAKWKQQTV